MKKRVIFYLILNYFFILNYQIKAGDTFISLDDSPDCPVCVHSLPDNIKVKSSSKRVYSASEIIYFRLSEPLSIDKIKKEINNANTNNKPICINVAGILKSIPKEEVLQIFSPVEKKRIVALGIWMPPEHNLTEKDEAWILSLTNLKELHIQAANLSEKFLSKLSMLKNLVRFHCVCFNSRQRTSALLGGISDHPSLEFLSLAGADFSNNIDWQLGKKVKKIVIDSSQLTIPIIKTIGQSTSVLHIEFINSKFPDLKASKQNFFSF